MVVMVVVVMMMGMGAQAGLHVSRELHLRYCEGHLVGTQAGVRCHVVAPELKHAGCGCHWPLVGEL